MKQSKSLIDVLKYWHKVEFFVPFDLDDVTANDEAKYHLSTDQLIQSGNRLLPWFSDETLTLAGGNPLLKKYRYNLYLCPFKKNEMTGLSKKIFPLDAHKEFHSFEFEEKLNDEGETCFAKIALDSKGKPDFKNITLSTLPWALGKLSEKKLSDLNAFQYEAELDLLKKQIELFSTYLWKENTIFSDGTECLGAMTASALVALNWLLKRWANFWPEHTTSVVFELIEDFKEQKEQKAIEDKTSQNELMPIEEKKPIPKKEQQQNEEVELHITFDILNSFYIEDLELIINRLSRENYLPLEKYVLGIEHQRRINLYKEKNYPFIIKKLSLNYINYGKWPTDNKHFMSLMQQFALNEIFHPSQEIEIFSVNGPPGTGKTTLFQDIITENIIRRAHALSKFKHVKKTFSEKKHISFSQQKVVLLLF